MASDKEAGPVDVADATSRLERQLNAAQQITRIGSWEWDLATGVVIWSDELYRIYGLVPRSCEITLEGFLARVHPDDRERVQRQVAAAVERGGRFSHGERIVRPDGSVRRLDSVGTVLVDAGGRPSSVVGTCRDITDDPRELAQRVQTRERQTLEMLATGATLSDVLAELALLVEEMAPEGLAALMLMDETGARLRHGAAPSLPDAFNRAMHDTPIGVQAGSCGTAAFRREPVLVPDIETNWLWEPHRDLARLHGLRACFAFPILNTRGFVVGAVAVYYRAAQAVPPAVVELVSRAVRVAAIAIERRQIDDRALALAERIEAIREDERTSVAHDLQGELGQLLAVLKLDVSWLARRLAGDPEVARKFDEMKLLADAMISSLSRISTTLRPAILDLLGLSAAIKWQGDDFTSRTGVPCEVNALLDGVHLDGSLATGVFRIFQEALSNITRHANASRVSVDIDTDDSMLTLQVADDGVGLPEGGLRGPSLGLLDMGERARRLGGECVVAPRVPSGTLVLLRVPLRPARPRVEGRMGPPAPPK